MALAPISHTSELTRRQAIDALEIGTGRKVAAIVESATGFLLIA